MEAFDTNVVLRLVYRDDIEQAERAARAWQAATPGGGIYLTTTVLVELARVLRVAAKFDRPAIANAIRRLTHTRGVTLEAPERIERALALFEEGPADFSDCVILEAAREADALPLITFDERLARHGGTALVSAD